MSGRRVDLADQLRHAKISIVGIQETRCRGQVTGSCRGFGVFAAAADKSGSWCVELWTGQDIMGDPRSFHVLVAEPRFLLVKGHTAAGVIQFCVCHGPDSTRDRAEIQAFGDQAADWEDTAGAEFLALLLPWDLCQPRCQAHQAFRNVVFQGRGGTGLILWLCLAIGSLG